MALNHSHRALHSCSHLQQPQPASSSSCVHGHASSSSRSRLPGNLRAKQLCFSRHASLQGEDEAIASNSAGPCWHALRAPAIWEGTEDEALRSPTSAFRGLPPTWKVLLLSDGSVTRHLQLLTSATTKADCFEMLDIGSSADALPPEVQSIPGPRIQRQVLLRPSSSLASPVSDRLAYTSSRKSDAASVDHTGAVAGPGNSGRPPGMQPLVYACSWWNADQAGMYLQDRSQPIWNSLSQGHVELYREVQHVYHGHNAHVEDLLGCPGPLWGRQYFFWHGGKPLTLIYEVFSPKLQDYLGTIDGANR
ncbi:hypothetical protein DUNSADRAFT_15714 [Dunaliella salina]|uniref:DUF98 domain-containing protein n=1 Tax=Dunaliella salina TaxID=3046 RepID=A0ABQ7G4U3_DUNSA|nr:hypothetical protein DUNSADRAFT_15714 [Dunaliella salina]|eukprot:KAF5829630.1 hypothetical protein DUNSADRAFT_15714 [Dunaliella salina]